MLKASAVSFLKKLESLSGGN